MKDREVDIPIVVIGSSNNRFYKYSVEFNHEGWHRNFVEKDKIKSYRLRANGWKHFIIEYESNSTYVVIEEQVSRISREIVSDITKLLEEKVK